MSLCIASNRMLIRAICAVRKASVAVTTIERLGRVLETASLRGVVHGGILMLHSEHMWWQDEVVLLSCKYGSRVGECGRSDTRVPNVVGIYSKTKKRLVLLPREEIWYNKGAASRE